MGGGAGGGGWNKNGGVEKKLIAGKKHFWGKNYIENYFYLLNSTKSTKTASQKC